MRTNTDVLWGKHISLFSALLPCIFVLVASDAHAPHTTWFPLTLLWRDEAPAGSDDVVWAEISGPDKKSNCCLSLFVLWNVLWLRILSPPDIISLLSRTSTTDGTPQPPSPPHFVFLAAPRQPPLVKGWIYFTAFKHYELTPLCLLAVYCSGAIKAVPLNIHQATSKPLRGGVRLQLASETTC